MNGRLEVIMGCMFSGKTSEMIRRVKRAMAIGKRVFVVNSSKDIRCEDSLQTHDKVNLKAVKFDTLSDILTLVDEYDIIAIDEFQFFSTDSQTTIHYLLCQGKTIIVSGLDGDFKQQKFGCITDLIPLADEVTKLTALCQYCGESAPFTKRTVVSTEQELVGASESYIAVCRKHLYSNSK